MSEDGIFCRIVEYEISWPSDLETSMSKYNFNDGGDERK